MIEGRYYKITSKKFVPKESDAYIEVIAKCIKSEIGRLVTNRAEHTFINSFILGDTKVNGKGWHARKIGLSYLITSVNEHNYNFTEISREENPEYFL